MIIAIRKFLSINAHLIISIVMATFVYHLLLGEMSFIRQFIPTLQKETAYLIVWDSFMTTYLILTVCMFVSIKSHEMEERAHREYEKKSIMLVLICITSVVSLISIMREMSIADQLSGWLATFHISLTFFTLVLSWLFMHTLFALYYAHAYHKADNNSVYPLDFPYEDEPDYWDFLYLALGIGATGSTADISFTSRKLRRLATFHSVLSFFFNTAVLALVMEMAGGLIS